MPGLSAQRYKPRAFDELGVLSPDCPSDLYIWYRSRICGTCVIGKADEASSSRVV
jgi:hypothetical protein